jgi:hypothetical protein
MISLFLPTKIKSVFSQSKYLKLLEKKRQRKEMFGAKIKSFSLQLVSQRSDFLSPCFFVKQPDFNFDFFTVYRKINFCSIIYYSSHKIFPSFMLVFLFI